MMCAARAGKDSCQGDSGGPLVTREGSYYSVIGQWSGEYYTDKACRYFNRKWRKSPLTKCGAGFLLLYASFFGG